MATDLVLSDPEPSEHPEDEIHVGLDKKYWLVHKFGGTSVANADCFQKVADIVENQAKNSPGSPQMSIAVVVSAMGGKPKTTDLLLKTVSLAAEREDVQSTLDFITEKHKTCLMNLFPDDEGERERLLAVVQQDLNNISDILKTVALMKWRASRISELVSGFGELWSAQILTALLRYRQNKKNNVGQKNEFVYLDARRLIIVDEEDDAIDWKSSEAKMKEVYEEETAKIDPSSVLHFVMTGYVATNTQGVATTLQRDGSDYSASILGRLLQANSVTIWTDVNGVLTADPRRVPHAQVVGEVSFNEAMELAYFGAKVIHPKTMQPAISAKPYQIPIYIRNTFEPAFPGTRIFATSTRHEDLDKVVCGFASVENIALVNVEGSGLMGVPGVAKRLFGRLEEASINVILISQASSEHTITFATVSSKASIAKEVIEDEFSRELRVNHVQSVDVISPCAIIAAVGDGMAHTSGVSSRFFSALGDAKINVLAVAQGSSERNISAVVLEKESTRALRAVHAAFRLSHTTIRIGIVGMNDLGESLLKLLEAQREALRSTFDLELQVCAILPKIDSEIIALTEDEDGGSESIGYNDYQIVTDEAKDPAEDGKITFDEEKVAQIVPSTGLSSMKKILFRTDYNNHVLFDCTNEEEAGKCHAEWLRAGVNIVTANNTGLSGPKSQRDELERAEKSLGKQSAQYLREVTVGGGLPIISTMRSLLQSGDRIRRVDGILSISLSFIMFRVSPPTDIHACSKFDEFFSKGAFDGDLALPTATNIGEACTFSQAVKEAIALGLMEEDPTKDLSNEYTSRILVILARELGMADLDFVEIQDASDKVVESIMHTTVDYQNLPKEMDEEIKKRVDAARSRGCVLRHIASINVKERSVEIKLVEVPDHHVFAVNPPSCECVRFFTHRHMTYPLTIQGPSAGADSTASALLAELLQLMRGKSSPRSVALSRTGSSASLKGTSVGILPPSPK